MAIDPSNPYSFIKRMVPETASNIDAATRGLQTKSALQELVNSGAFRKAVATQGMGDVANMQRKKLELNIPSSLTQSQVNRELDLRSTLDKDEKGAETLSKMLKLGFGYPGMHTTLHSPGTPKKFKTIGSPFQLRPQVNITQDVATAGKGGLLQTKKTQIKTPQSGGGPIKFPGQPTKPNALTSSPNQAMGNLNPELYKSLVGDLKKYGYELLSPPQLAIGTSGEGMGKQVIKVSIRRKDGEGTKTRDNVEIPLHRFYR